MNQKISFSSRLVAFFKILGPAFIVASVVLGPGSILTNSKVGAAHGLSLIWVLVLAAGLMMGMVALAARLGVVLDGTLCDELARRVGRPLAVVVGLTVFLICAGFQFGNNLGVLAALEPWLQPLEETAESGVGLPRNGEEGVVERAAGEASTDPESGVHEPSGNAASDARDAATDAPPGLLSASNLILFALNAIIIAVLFGFDRLYKPIERLMMVLVALMIVGFFGNLLYMLLVEAPATQGEDSGVPAASSSGGMLAALGLVGTTFSVGGAFYQAYLVREKGWGMDDVRKGVTDSIAGISVLATVSLAIMASAALAFHGRSVDLRTVADVAKQLDPLFGSAAVVLFSVGIFAGAFSSFLVNAMIGGTLLSDGLGLGGRMDATSTKLFTALALLTGMLVAVFLPPGDRVGWIVFAQAATVIGLPLLAATLLYLAMRPELTGARAIPAFLRVVAVLGLIAVLVAAGLLAMRVLGSIWSGD